MSNLDLVLILFLFFFFSSQNMALLSLNGLEILNRLLLSIQKFHPKLIESDSDELAQIIQIYSDFILSACSNLKKKNITSAYKKFLFLISKISGFENKFKNALLKHAESNSESCNMLLSLGFLLQFYHETKSSEFNDLKVASFFSFILKSTRNSYEISMCFRENWRKCIRKGWSARKANLNSGWSNAPITGSNMPPKRSLRK